MLPIVFHPAYETPLRARGFSMSKYGYLRRALTRDGFAEEWFHAPALANPPLLMLAHERAYVDRFLTLSLSTAEVKRIGLAQSSDLRRRVRYSTAGTLLAARLALRYGVACNAAGGSHHADYAGGAGYCVFNDVAVAAAALLSDGTVGAIAVIDLDVHQGDGTARIFAGIADVVTVSVHCAANFPTSKAESDVDIALPVGASDTAYLNAVDEALAQIPPVDIVFYNAGVDPHRNDRLGRLEVSDEGIQERDRRVMAWAQARHIPITGVLGGGYGTDPAEIAERHMSLFKAARAIA